MFVNTYLGILIVPKTNLTYPKFTQEDLNNAGRKAVAGCKLEYTVKDVTMRTSKFAIKLNILSIYFTPQGLHVVVEHQKGL